MKKFDIGDLVSVNLSHSRKMTGLIVALEEKINAQKKTFIVHDTCTGRKAHAWAIDMELISASK